MDQCLKLSGSPGRRPGEPARLASYSVAPTLHARGERLLVSLFGLRVIVGRADRGAADTPGNGPDRGSLARPFAAPGNGADGCARGSGAESADGAADHGPFRGVLSALKPCLLIRPRLAVLGVADLLLLGIRVLRRRGGSRRVHRLRWRRLRWRRRRAARRQNGLRRGSVLRRRLLINRLRRRLALG